VDEIIHQPLRLKIMAALAATPGEPLDFKRLKAVTEATDGNLGRQLQTLAEAGYITVLKDYANNRPRTRAELTSTGERAFANHVDYLGKLLRGL
jgi:DNA-binding MarR family transcriptional regulator